MCRPRYYYGLMDQLYLHIMAFWISYYLLTSYFQRSGTRKNKLFCSITWYVFSYYEERLILI